MKGPSVRSPASPWGHLHPGLDSREIWERRSPLALSACPVERATRSASLGGLRRSSIRAFERFNAAQPTTFSTPPTPPPTTTAAVAIGIGGGVKIVTEDRDAEVGSGIDICHATMARRTTTPLPPSLRRCSTTLTFLDGPSVDPCRTPQHWHGTAT